MDYFSNEGQLVTREDAKQIADALEEGLQDIPEEISESCVVETLVSAWLEDRGLKVMPMSSMFGLGLFLYFPPDKLSPNVFFIEERKDQIKNFIRFCHGGSFRIW